MNRSPEAGQANPLLISTILFAVLTVVFGGVMAWALVNYLDQKNNVDSKVAAAVEVAKESQATELEKAFVEREKEPYVTFNGPAELGSVEFKYPKTWSVYVANNGDNNELVAYLHPVEVPPVDNEAQVIAVKVEVRNESYESVLGEYEGMADDGSLKATPYKINDYRGIRFSGKLDDDHSGAAVLFKVRDKTLIFTSNSKDFVRDLDAIVLKNLQFNP